MSEPVLQVIPKTEIRFKGPFTGVVVAEISLHNVSEKRACFKIKTTAPKQYCVRPNCGIVDPGKTAIVAVMLQPFEYDGQEKVKHKFLILSMPAPDVPVESVDQLWKDPPTDKVFETKLRCVFDLLTPPDTQQASKDTSKVAQQPINESKPTLPRNVSQGKLKQEVKPDDDLIAERKKLLEENNQLKQETLRLRNIMKASSTSNYITVSRPPDTPGAISLFTAGLMAVAAIVLGLLLGKFFI